MKKKITISILIITIALASSFISAMAAEEERYGMVSQGRIEFTNGTEDKSDDVIFDASDLYILAKKCQ